MTTPQPQPTQQPTALGWSRQTALAAGLVGFGFADFSLVAFHLSKAQTVAPEWVPVFYAFAMGAGGLGSLALGKLFDRSGLSVLVPVPVVVVAYAPWAACMMFPCRRPRGSPWRHSCSRFFPSLPRYGRCGRKPRPVLRENADVF